MFAAVLQSRRLHFHHRIGSRSKIIEQVIALGIRRRFFELISLRVYVRAYTL